jgi:rRNA processing protein Gar1
MKIGDLVQSNNREEKVGVIVDIFGDLNPDDPWVRVRWTSPGPAFEWCKINGLSLLSQNATKNE